jgi:phosphoribosylformylglycinamidine synthase
MIHFFENQSKTCSTNANEISAQDISKLNWFFADVHILKKPYSRIFLDRRAMAPHY